jgi:hypothetical protein
LVSGDQGQSSPPPSPVRIAGQVVANASLLIAILVYMGWAYDDAYLGYFHVSPLDLNVGVVEYMLRSLNLFRSGIVLVAAGVVVLSAVRAWGLGATPRFIRHAAFRAKVRLLAHSAFRRLVPVADVEQLHIARPLLIGAGTAVMATGLVLAWLARFVTINTYLVLALLGGGVLLLAWPSRARRYGGFSYSLAVVVAAVCTLWAAALYAHTDGTRAAQALVRNLPSRTAVVVYSVQPLALSGPGVIVQHLSIKFRYQYRYQGLRLLIDRSQTYYILPIAWNPQRDITYILDSSDQVRIELLSGVVRSNS